MNAPTVVLRNAPVLERETRDGVALLTMNRPEQRNTLSEAMLTALMESFGTIATDPAHQSRRRVGRGDASRARPGKHDRAEIGHDRQDRQTGVLPPARDAARGSVSLCFAGHDRKHDGARCRGRHLRPAREAPPEM